jgi:hypothetical protein
MTELTKLIMDRKWTQAIQYINLWPKEASKLTVYTFKCGTRITCFPIHLACMRKPPIEIITAFVTSSRITQNKKYLLTQDSVGRCPIHHACRYNAPCDVIQVLISLCPKSLYVKSYDGCLPIHLLCLHAKSQTLLKAIVHMLWIMPTSVEVMDDHGLTPKDLIEDNPNQELREELKSILLHAERNLVKEEETAAFLFNTSVEWKSLQVEQTNTDDTSSSTAATEMSEINAKMCIICWSKCACRVLLPCGHISLCEACSTDVSLSKMGWKCPECRGAIREAITIYGRVLAE